jgi:prepilin-type N-terminal cleavage/methylation domain-containing protein
MNKQKAFSLIELSLVILIIGILITGVVQGSRLLTKMRLNTARSITQSSDVISIPDLVFWLDATREDFLINASNSTNLNNADLIQTWRSYNPQNSLFNASFTQSTSANRPAYLEDGINNLPTLYFDAATNATSGKTLTMSYATELNPNQFTIFVVTKPMEATTDFGAIVMNRSEGPLYGFTLYKSQNTPNFLLMSGNGAWDIRTLNFSTFNNSYILSGLHNGSNVWLYLNGKTFDTAATTYISQSINDFRIGSANTGIYYYDGQISEIIFYGRGLKTEERQAVERYLGKKYGIKVS